MVGMAGMGNWRGFLTTEDTGGTEGRRALFLCVLCAPCGYLPSKQALRLQNQRTGLGSGSRSRPAKIFANSFSIAWCTNPFEARVSRLLI
jgi:hypothetical protein